MSETAYEPGDLISYRAVHADVDPHQARVDHVTDRGLVVLDEPPPRGSGMPLTHLVTWDRVIGRVPEVAHSAAEAAAAVVGRTARER